MCKEEKSNDKSSYQNRPTLDNIYQFLLHEGTYIPVYVNQRSVRWASASALQCKELAVEEE
tara:strand:+ start:377 stop:559 length:183 start_codon:yes stop_codon:yes gene_type:complete